MSIVTQDCNVTCSKEAKFGERSLTFGLKVGNGQTLADLSKEIAALGIHESQVCSLFWSQFVTNVQNVARPYLRTAENMKDSTDKDGKPIKGAENLAFEAVAKYLESVKKPAGESRPMSEATAKRKAAEKQASAIQRLGEDVKAGDKNAKAVQQAIITSKSGLGCLQAVALEYVTKGAEAAVKLAQAS